MNGQERLAGPFEILELGNGETLTTRLGRWEMGKMEIHPSYQPEGKWITALRVHVPEDQKGYFPWYWDITSRSFKAQLLPILEAGGFE